MGMEKELENVNKELKEHKFNAFTEGCTKAGTVIESVGKKASALSAAAVATGTASVKAAEDLKEGYDIVVTKTGATDDALKDLKKSANNVFGTMPEDMATVGEAIGEVNTRFHTTGDELESTSKQFIQFASINDTNITQSVDQVDKMMKAWNVDASQTGNLLGLLTAKAQATGISVDTLESEVLDNNSALKQMGLSMPQSINLMAQFDENGVNASTALAGLKKALQNATSEGKTMDEALKDTIGSIKNAKTDTEALKIAQELFGKKGAAEMATAIRENRIDLNDLSSSMKQYGNTVESTYNNTKSPLDNAKTAMNNAKIAMANFGETALQSAAPMISKATTKVQDLTKKFTSLNDKQQQTVLKVGLVTAAIGPATVATGKLVKGVGDTVKGVKKGIELGGKAVSAVKKVAAKIIEKTAATAAGTTADTAATAATAAHTTATAAATATTGTMTAAQTALNVAMKLCPILMIVGLITGLIAAGVALYKNWDKISAFGTKLWGNIKKDFNNIKKSVTDSFKKSGEAVENNVKKMTNSVKNSAIGKATSTVFKAIHKTVEDNMKASAASAKKNLDEMKSAYKKNGGGIKGIVAATMTGIRNHYKSKYDEINKLTGGKLDIMVQKTREGFKKAANSIAEKVSQARKNASSFATGIVTEVGKIPGKVKTVGINLVKGLWNGISNMQSWVISKVRGFGNSVLTGLKNFFGIHSPSKVMEEQIGKNLALGVANGITKHKKHAKKSASEMGSEIVKAAKKKLDTYKTYHKMSLKQETEYWDTVRKQIKKGTSARTEADKKYLADKKSLNSQLTKAQKEYAKSEKQINADLKKEIKNLTNEYKNAVKERKDSLLSSFSLFESYDAGDTVSKSDLLVGMQTQVEALNEWERQIATLKSRLGNTELFKTIQEMGVSGLQQVKAINSMTEEELKRYTSLYKERQTSAKDEATTELKGTKKSTDDKIAKANKQAQEKLTKAQKTYTDVCKKLGVTGAAAVKKTVDGAEKPLTKSLDKIQKNTKKAISTAVSTTKKGATQLKRAMDFKWSLPRLKMPHISVSSGKTPYGIGGKGSVPKFKVEYYKTGGIMTNPTVFGLNGNSWMVGGEAGAEAILPLQEFYQKFSSILDKKFEAVQKAQAVGVTCYTYIDGDEIASRTVTKVDSKMVTDKRKRR